MDKKGGLNSLFDDISSVSNEPITQNTSKQEFVMTQKTVTNNETCKTSNRNHGPVISPNSQIKLTQEEVQALKPEDIELYKQGWSFEWENVELGDGASPVKIKYKIPPKPIDIYEQYMWKVLDEYEEKAWSSQNIGLKSGWPSIDNGFDGGIKSGFIIIGGDSNLGKSGFMSQMAIQIADYNDNVYVIDFSLDDPMQDKIPRIVGSHNKILLNAVKSPNQFSGMQIMLSRRKTGLLKLRNMTDKYRAYDANFSTNIEDLEEEIIRVKTEMLASGVEKRVVVFIDNMHDLTVRDTNFMGNDKAKYDFIAQWCSDLATRYDIPVICSAELKKLNGARRPGLDDIREAVKIKYEAKAILLVYNEVHYKGEGASVFFRRNDKATLQPVFEVHFAKNKFHSYKGRLFFEFYPEMARFEEPDDQSKKTYASVVFGQ